MPVPYELLCAVQDLYELYSRFGPRGPYRLQLFHDQPDPSAAWPQAVQERAERLDLLIRGISCLLANDLAGAALPVTAELFRQLRALEAAAAGRQPPSAYYSYLAHELASAPRAALPAYRLFGEVLAVYLDMLVEVRPDLREQFGSSIRHLRQRVLQTGETSSASGAG